MVQLKKKKIGKMDEYHYIGIPKSLFDTGVLSIDKEYTITIEESEEKENGGQ